jgi:uncharacterized iron-regulated membrane protein
MSLRKILFWLHLCAGTTAGIVILIMSVTGVLLMYERQMIAWADRGYRQATPSPAEPVPIETLLTKVREAENAFPATLVTRSDAAAPVEASFGRERSILLDPYTGAILGEGARGIRTFFRVVTDWHRWLGQQGESRPTGRAITGAANLAFLFIVMSGFYLWWPRKWSGRHLISVTLFRSGLSGKARDFNWHNVIGFWCAIPLFFIVLGGVMISYPWATNLLYRATGSEPPASAGSRPAAPPARSADSARDVSLEGMNEAWASARQQVPGWEAITLRMPASSRGPLSFTIDLAHRGRPDKRTTVSIARGTGEVVQSENFSDFNRGRKARTWLRWIHTGEAGGIAGQTIAGIVSGGAGVLVWTGLALTLRRFRASRARAKSKEGVLVET